MGNIVLLYRQIVFIERFGFFVFSWIISAILGGERGELWKVVEVNYLAYRKSSHLKRSVGWISVNDLQIVVVLILLCEADDRSHPLK